MSLIGISAAGYVLPDDASAAPGRETFITMFGDRNDPISDGQLASLHPGNSEIRASVRPEDNSIVVLASHSSNNWSYGFVFQFPKGEKMAVGDYRRARASDYRGPHRRPGIEIGRWREDMHLCPVMPSGRFTVKRLVRSDTHTISSLWIVYEQRCEGVPVFGEIRYRMPGDGGALTVGPRRLRFPTVGAAGSVPVVPVRVVNPTDEPVTVTTVGLPIVANGFSIRYDECTSVVVAPGEMCAIWMRFDPSTPGTFASRLTVTEEDGSTHGVLLDARVDDRPDSSPTSGEPGGSVGSNGNTFTFESDPGDYIGRGRSGTYEYPGEGPVWVDIYAEGDVHAVEAIFRTSRGHSFHMSFIAPVGDILAPGLHFTDVITADPSAAAAGLAITDAPEPCASVTGSFTVHALRIGADGRLKQFSVSFEQHCDGAQESFRGRLDFSLPRESP